MTDEKLAAIEARATAAVTPGATTEDVLEAVRPMQTLALIAEVRRLREMVGDGNHCEGRVDAR